LHTVKTSCAIPFSIKVTGYKEGEAYPFTSRDLHPYLRCFCIQGEIAVVIGWPCEGDHYPKLLDELRRSMQFANVLHKYHASLNDIDNDFFFTVGRISSEKISNILLQQVCGTIRSLLSSMDTTSIEISRDCLSVVAYVDPKLPLTTSYAYTLDEAEAKLDEIRSLYRKVAA
jgi:DNA-binding Lrp family transcriptional regulator